MFVSQFLVAERKGIEIKCINFLKEKREGKDENNSTFFFNFQELFQPEPCEGNWRNEDAT